MSNFIEFVAAKCLEANDYDLFMSLNWEAQGIELSMELFYFCDDPRFSSLFYYVLSNRIPMDEDTEVRFPTFGNRDLESRFLDAVYPLSQEEENEEYSSNEQSSSHDSDFL